MYTEGKEYFSIEMWDTFPLPYMTPTSPRWAEVEKRGQALRRGETGARQALDEFIDNLFVPMPPDSFSLLNSARRKILDKMLETTWPFLLQDILSYCQKK